MNEKIDTEELKKKIKKGYNFLDLRTEEYDFIFSEVEKNFA